MSPAHCRDKPRIQAQMIRTLHDTAIVTNVWQAVARAMRVPLGPSHQSLCRKPSFLWESQATMT